MSKHMTIPNINTFWRLLATALLALLVTACSSTGGNNGGSNNGRYAMDKDAGPDDGIVLDPDKIPDAVPVDEPRTAAGNKSPYTVLGETYTVMPESSGYTQKGKASWYGKKFHGYKTSNGEIYSMYKMSGAHKTLPIPSYVRVTNLDNGRKAIVRINDRGPFHSDRIIDLSYAAAVKLDVTRTGTANVRLEAIDPTTNAYAAREAEKDELPALTSSKSSRKKAAPPAVIAATHNEPELPQEPTASGKSATYLQAGAFRNEDSANALREKLADLTGKPVKVDSSQGLHKVRIGPLANPGTVSEITDLLVQNNFGKPQIVYF